MSKYIYILPEIIMAIYALFAVLVGVFNQKNKKLAGNIFSFNAILFLVILYILLYINTHSKFSTHSLFNKAYIFDHISYIFKVLTCLICFSVSLIGYNNYQTINSENASFELPILVILSTIGIFLMISGADLITVYLGLELSSLALYILVSFNHNSEKSTEAGVKYFVLGALASGILLFGASLLYGFSGSTNFAEIFTKINSFDGIKNFPPAFILGLVLFFSGLFFKLSLAPFHMWAPDVYEGATKLVLSFIATAPKIGSLAVLIKIISGLNSEIYKPIQMIFIVVSILSMLVGAFGGLMQSNIKRLIAYSGIANMGYLLISVLVGSEKSVQASIIFTVIYMVSTIGLLSILTLLKRNNSEDLCLTSDFSGLSKTNPYIAVAVAIFLFSIAGIPPFAGFLAKFVVFKQAIMSKFYTLAVIGVVASVVACFYYLRIIKFMYFDNLKQGYLKLVNDNINITLKILIIFCTGFTLLLFLFFDNFVFAVSPSPKIADDITLQGI
jgi:NADH-quinone oxidoreductase subunit N